MATPDADTPPGPAFPVPAPAADPLPPTKTRRRLKICKNALKFNYRNIHGRIPPPNPGCGLTPPIPNGRWGGRPNWGRATATAKITASTTIDSCRLNLVSLHFAINSWTSNYLIHFVKDDWGKIIRQVNSTRIRDVLLPSYKKRAFYTMRNQRLVLFWLRPLADDAGSYTVLPGATKSWMPLGSRTIFRIKF